MNGSLLLIATVSACAFLGGAILALPGAVAACWANHLHLSEARARLLRALLLVLLVPMMVVSGLLIDKWDVQTLLLTGALLAVLGLVLLAHNTTPWSAMGAVVLLAGANAALLTGSLVTMPEAFFPNCVTRSLCLGTVAVVVGTLLTPALVRGIAKRLEPRKALLLMAMACLVPAAGVACLPADELAQPKPVAPWTRLLEDYHLGLLGLLVLLACPLEVALAGWCRRHVVERGYLPGSTAVLRTGFWLAFLGARLTTALLLPTGGEALLVIVLALIAAVTLGNMLGDHVTGGGPLGLWLAGACCGPLVPAVLGLVLSSYPHDVGPVLGLANAVGTLGTLVLLPVMEKSSRAALRVSTMLALLLLGPALVVALLG
jgi:hypothetical protein